MDINTFTVIGNDHKICEDYSISGLLPFPFFIISDGCSSAPNTDIGSRVLVSMAKKNISLLTTDYNLFLEKTIAQSKAIVSLMGIETESLLATLFIVLKLEDKVIVLSIGDGDIIYKNNLINHLNFEYDKNIPFYPIYIKKIFDNKNNLIITKNGFKEIRHFSYINYIELPLDNLEWIICSTDGIKSFTNGVDLFEGYENLVDFKNFKGDFIERKMKRFIKNLLKEGYKNSDDWTMGGISFGDDK